MSEFNYCLSLRSKYNLRNLPMSKWRARSNGKARLICTMTEDKMLKFKDREDALFYLSNLYDKYGDDINKWKPMKIDTLRKLMRKNPIRQLHTNKTVSKF